MVNTGQISKTFNVTKEILVEYFIDVLDKELDINPYYSSSNLKRLEGRLQKYPFIEEVMFEVESELNDGVDVVFISVQFEIYDEKSKNKNKYNYDAAVFSIDFSQILYVWINQDDSLMNFERM